MGSQGEGEFSHQERAWRSIEATRPVGKDAAIPTSPGSGALPEPAPSGCPTTVVHTVRDIGTGCEGGGKMGWAEAD
jgi:hypothetical protein